MTDTTTPGLVMLTVHDLPSFIHMGIGNDGILTIIYNDVDSGREYSDGEGGTWTFLDGKVHQLSVDDFVNIGDGPARVTAPLWRVIDVSRTEARSNGTWFCSGNIRLAELPFEEIAGQRDADVAAPQVFVPAGFRVSVESSIPPDEIHVIGATTEVIKVVQPDVPEPAAKPAPALDLPRLILLNGLPRVGKDTVARHLVERHGYTQIAFADQVKRDVEKLFPFISHRVMRLMDMTGVHGDDTVEDQEWAWRAAWDAYKAKEPVARQKLQQYAEMVKERTTEHAWVDIVINTIGPLLDQNSDSRFVISDLRFPFELDRVWYYLGKYSPRTVRITREGVMASDHVSEQWTPELSYLLPNNSTMQDLLQDMDKVLKQMSRDLLRETTTS